MSAPEANPSSAGRGADGSPRAPHAAQPPANGPVPPPASSPGTNSPAPAATPPAEPWYQGPTTKPDPATRAADLDRLRQLLLSPEHRRLLELEAKVNDPLRYTNDIIEQLPHAVTVRTKRDSKLAEALAPTVDQSVAESVRRNPQRLVDAISPIMGPAIRKSISDALADLVASFNAAAAQSLSLQGLRWRLEAWRTGVPYERLVFIKSFVYRVEQAFFIHRETGLVLCHAVRQGVEAPDADMVAGMLTAIRDFSRDAAKAGPGANLDGFKMGEHTWYVETGNAALLAVRIRGTLTGELRERIQDTFTTVQLELAAPLAAFKGDVTPFDAARPRLEELLQREQRGEAAPAAKRKGGFPFFWVALIVAIALLGWWWLTLKRDQWRFDDYLARLNAIPGVSVVRDGTQNGPSALAQWLGWAGWGRQRTVTGFVDPAVRGMVEKARDDAGIPADRLVASWIPAYAVDDASVIRRVLGALRPPAGIKVEVSGGVLKTSGAAPHAWWSRARREAPGLPGVVRYDDSQLRNLGLEELTPMVQRVETRAVRFAFGSNDLLPNQDVELAELCNDLLAIRDAADRHGIDYVIQVIGNTDSSGTEERNARLSRDRADRVIALFASRGVPEVKLVPLALASAKPVTREASETERARNRQVRVRVLLREHPEWLRAPD